MTKSYCTPESYKGTSSKLYRNLGGGRFEDVSRKAGVDDPTSKSLGVSVFDDNGDGCPTFVANDTQPNKLYRNNTNGTFIDEALSAGVAYSEDGVARGAMGADSSDYDPVSSPRFEPGRERQAVLRGGHTNHVAARVLRPSPASRAADASGRPAGAPPPRCAPDACVLFRPDTSGGFGEYRHYCCQVDLVSHPADFSRQDAAIGDPYGLPNTNITGDIQPGTMPNGT